MGIRLCVSFLLSKTFFHLNPADASFGLLWFSVVLLGLGRCFGSRIVLTLGFGADMMKVYAKRIEVLATKAVTAKVWD